MTSRLSSTFVIGVISTLGVVVWAGCGSSDEGRYQCDHSGCFQCDAYGCSSVSASAHPTCSGNASCGAGSVCTTTGCTKACSSDATCPRGETCQSGLCSAPGTAPGTKKECTTKSDCSDGKTCNAGACQACGGSAGPCPCTATSDCASGQACVAGACTAAQNACKYTSECELGKVCANGQCLTNCDSTPCGAGFTCDKSVCQPLQGGGGTSCTGDAQCTSPDAPNCVSGSCIKACDGDAVCGAGKYCNQGSCVVDTRPKPNCTTDDQCGGTAGTPKKCVGGYCKYTCTTDQYCRTIDTRIGYCAKDGVCRNATEASASCLVPTDCSSGQSCVDNTCK